ncbi:metallophosphoesterase [Gemmata sp. JC717]|uniref:metallophosphoesterase n=1 Tax=Gemmata algarum TaxID=2975278 RepID=UPI0021BB88A9|nr:metallophosphoesterase [Gemmata algarum]MDY3555476.1 metallophosphoesterase [Gemmata algarum]
MNPDDTVTVLIPGDLHLTEAGLPNHAAAVRTVADANELIRPDFVQFIGDNVQDGTDEQFSLLSDLCARLRVPWFALVGDHDAQGDPAACRFRARVGDPCGSLSVRGFRFVRLNTQEAHPVGLSARQMTWFRAEVDAARAAGERVVVLQHNYPYQIWEDFAGAGTDAWREVVQTRRVHAIVSGHTHYWQLANDGRNAAVAVRSIGDPEGGPPGYAVAAFHGEDFAVAYRPVDDCGPLVLVTHPREAILATGPAHVVTSADEVRARVWSAEPVRAVGLCVDGGAWVPMGPCGNGFWRAPLPGSRLAKGVHRLVVRAEDGTGGAGAHEVEFAVDPTGRYTAVPMVRPLVTSTAFC